MKTITATDRSALIRLAATLPAGSPERRAILGGMREAKLRDITRAANVFVESMTELEDAARKLKRLFKQHPITGEVNDWGQGEAAERLVADTLKAIKKLRENPVMLDIYATFSIENTRKKG